MKLAITGIGTDVGKTLASAIVVKALNANYWKPVQAGDLDNSDSIKLKGLVPGAKVLKERYTLSEPMSPHAAAEIDDVIISIHDFDLPETDDDLVVEGAGGLMVPFNSEGLLFVDLLEKWKLPTIIVSRHYLGSINHTLLTAEVLKQRGVKVLGILFNGNENLATEEIILKNTGLRKLGRFPQVSQVDESFITQQADLLKKEL